MFSSRSMFHRTAELTLALSLGALPLASAEAARGSRQTSSIPQANSARSIVQAWLDPLLSLIGKNGSHPGNKPGSGTSDAKPEGSGVCPDGKPGTGPKPGFP